MRYRVRHATRYDYAEPVDLAAHLVHLRPRPLARQHVLQASLAVEPAPQRRSEGLDHFGNPVVRLFVERPHARFEIVLQALVEVSAAPDLPALGSPPWEAVAESARAGGKAAWHAAEFAFDSAMAAADAATAAWCAESFPPGRSIVAALLDLSGRINRDFAFRAGVTTIATPVSRVMAQRAGVCQDFAHLMIAGLRALGLPARYVSGYLRTRPPPGRPRLRGADASHAWVGCWLGPEHGWLDLDPTNDLVVGEQHVVLGWGRDYGDVSPVRGVILGGGRHRLTVAVDLDPA